jgi:hypothetical protein
MLRRVVAVLVAVVSLGVLSAAASAEAACPNEAFRVEHGMTALPDCRAYEQVSPVEKNGADVLGYETNVRAAADGHRVTFASYGGFAGAEGLRTFDPYFATRGAQGWGASALYPPQEQTGTEWHNQAPQPLGYSEQLSSAFLRLGGPPPPGVVGAQSGTENLYVRDLETGQYTLLTSAGALSGNSVGFSAGTPDFSHLLFESPAKLTPDAPIDNPAAPFNLEPTNLYESVNGKVRLASILPNGEAAEGARAGSASPEPNPISGGATQFYYTQNTISTDGSTVFWTDSSSYQLYARINGAETLHVSGSQRTLPDPAGTKPAFFLEATPSGSTVYFTSEENLTNDATNGPSAKALYAYDTGSHQLTDLTVPPSGSEPKVLGVLGAGESTSGSFVYFAATGTALAPGAPSAQELFEANEANLYAWHAGQVTYIATLSAYSGDTDEHNWEQHSFENNLPKQSRVTPSGQYLLFGSQRQLTAYDNGGHQELYRYDGVSHQLTCVTCNPRSAVATDGATLGTGAPAGQATIRLTPFLTNVMSSDGQRIFFQTNEALVSADTNGRADVYEWEEGQLHLISSGQAATDSYLGDASVTGEDVFFVTRQSLVGQDQDANIDMYDARVGGGMASQFPAAATIACSGDVCHGASPQPPATPLPASEIFNGAGNLTTQLSTAPKPLTRAQKLARALKACRSGQRRRRPLCERRARKRYGAAHKAHRASGATGKSNSSSRRTK